MNAIETPPLVSFLQHRGGIFLENLEALDVHIEYVLLKIEEFAALLAFLEERRRNIIAIQKGHEVSAQIQTEKLIERMKNDRDDN